MNIYLYKFKKKKHWEDVVGGPKSLEGLLQGEEEEGEWDNFS